MAPFALDAHPLPDAFGRKESSADRWGGQKDRRFSSRERMKQTGGFVCNPVSMPAAGDLSAQKQCAKDQRAPPGGYSQFRLAGNAASVQKGSQPTCGQPHPEAEKPKTYGEMLAEQVEEKRARKAAEKKMYMDADRMDDHRVQREAAQLRGAVEGEIAKQRHREAVVAAREDSLSRFLSEQGGERHSDPPQDDALEARRRSVPGLCGKPPPAPSMHPSAAGKAPAATGLAGNRSRSTPPGRQSSPWATDCDQPEAPKRPHRSASPANPLVPGNPVDAVPARGISSNVWASGASQNSGNFISDRPSSRVVQPPGGGSSLQLGW